MKYNLFSQKYLIFILPMINHQPQIILDSCMSKYFSSQVHQFILYRKKLTQGMSKGVFIHFPSLSCACEKICLSITASHHL